MEETRRPRIAAVGMASWDRLLVVEDYPGPGEYRVVVEERSMPGGTTTNAAVALSRLGARVSLAAMVGDDANGAALRAALAAEPGIDLGWLATRTGEPTDASTIVVSRNPPDRTIYWHPGAKLVRRDRLDLEAIFTHDVVLFDVADHGLRQWLTDLPSHLAPRTRLLGTLTYLVERDAPIAEDALAVALRFDALIGNEREFRAITGAGTAEAATEAIQAMMPGANLRTGIMTRGAAGCRIVTRREAWDIPGFAAEPVDVTGAGDAFAAGIAYAMASRRSWPEAGRLANAMGALATRGLGAQSTLPTWAEVETLVGR